MDWTEIIEVLLVIATFIATTLAFIGILIAIWYDIEIGIKLFITGVVTITFINLFSDAATPFI